MENYVKYDLGDHNGITYREKFGAAVPVVELSGYAELIIDNYWMISSFRNSGSEIEPLSLSHFKSAFDLLGYSLNRNERIIIYEIDAKFRNGVMDRRQKNMEAASKTRR